MKLLIFYLFSFHPFEYRQLTWADFKGPAERDGAAMTQTSIELTTIPKDDTYFFKIGCYFDPTGSWTKTRDPFKLRHEQGHFALSEIFKRKIALALQPYQGTGNKKEAERIYDELIVQWDAQEQQYDRETDHSLNIPEQNRWNNLIDKLLKQ